ncbi:hypothetical protein [Flavobacterium sp.]|jgi:hypothetical protein|uniref:hypothetical protein n=1 Tax=Flavobacterium sp. TaxID=239 RepID=UPI0037845157
MKTAVEQFLDAIKDQIPLSNEHLEMIESYASQAKEMEKEQHKQTWTEGMFCETGDKQAFIDYYKKTFKSE